jgi:hypothetical protein
MELHGNCVVYTVQKVIIQLLIISLYIIAQNVLYKVKLQVAELVLEEL